MSENTISPIGRVSYPHLTKPYVPQGSDGSGKYEINLWFAPDADLKVLKAEARRAHTEKFGPEMPKDVVYESPFKNDVDENGAAIIVVKFKTAFLPGVWSRSKQPIIDIDSEVYPGCFARVSCGAFGWTFGSKRAGVSFNFSLVQKIKDGDPLGDRPSVDIFDDLESEEDDDFSDNDMPF